MQNNNFGIFEFFIILIMLIYIVFGFFSYYFSLNTRRSEVEQLSLPAKLLYWHGIVFVVGFILTSVLLLFYSIFAY